MATRLLLLFTLGLLLFLSACGDSSDRQDRIDPPDTLVMTGHLVDAAVSGVAYDTSSHQGITGADGSFQYKDGETIKFMLGDTLLGELLAKEQITPFDLAGSPPVIGTKNIVEALKSEGNTAPNTGITENLRNQLEIEEQDYVDPFHTVINIAILLQSMDSDANPENGIEITAEITALFEGVTLDLKQRWEVFSDEFTLRHALGQANTLRLFSQDHGLTRPATALHTFTQRLKLTRGFSA